MKARWIALTVLLLLIMAGAIFAASSDSTKTPVAGKMPSSAPSTGTLPASEAPSPTVSAVPPATVTPSPVAPATPGPTAVAPLERVYTVMLHDTVAAISASTGDPWADICSRNRTVLDATAIAHGFAASPDCHWIFPGERLALP